MAFLPDSRGGRNALAAALIGSVVLGLAGFARRATFERADFVFTNGGEVRSLDPHAVTGVPEGRVVRALFEGLLTRDPVSAAPRPGVAESWTSSKDGLVWSFRLRADARWSNGDPVTAEDFEWSFRRLLAPETAAEYASQLWCVVGAREFTAGAERDWSRVGIRALDPRTLELRLGEAAPSLLDVLAMHVLAPVHRASLERVREQFPSTWTVEWTRAENLVTNGPYRLLERRLNDRMRLVANESYWDAEHVAMRTIDVLAVENWNAALNLYLTGEVDWVDGAIPSTLVRQLVGREDFASAPYLGVYFYRVNTTRPPLDDKRVRRALSAALQRAEICKNLLGAGQKPATTFVPWGACGSYRSPRGVIENENFAKAEFGAARAKDTLRSLEIHFNSSEVHRDIAEVIAARWKRVLGIDVVTKNQEWKAFLDAQSSLAYEVSRSSWIADYADPANFLEIWLSDSENNRTGWKHAGYDQLVHTARTERDATKRNALYQRAEAILLDELPCIPIYSYVSQNLVDARIGGFTSNALNEPSLADLYWRDDDELRAARAKLKPQIRRVESHGPRAGLHAPGDDAEGTAR